MRLIHAATRKELGALLKGKVSDQSSRVNTITHQNLDLSIPIWSIISINLKNQDIKMFIG